MSAAQAVEEIETVEAIKMASPSSRMQSTPGNKTRRSTRKARCDVLPCAFARLSTQDVTTLKTLLFCFVSPTLRRVCVLHRVFQRRVAESETVSFLRARSDSLLSLLSLLRAGGSQHRQALLDQPVIALLKPLQTAGGGGSCLPRPSSRQGLNRGWTR